MDEELPRAHVKRLVKAKLCSLDNVDAKGQSFEPNIQKEALVAYGECAKIFIHYLTATANDICRDHKRSIISAEDVLAAIDECDFPELVDDVRGTLSAFQSAKKKKKASATGQGAEASREGEREEEEEEEEEKPSSDVEGEDGEA